MLIRMIDQFHNEISEYIMEIRKLGILKFSVLIIISCMICLFFESIFGNLYWLIINIFCIIYYCYRNKTQIARKEFLDLVRSVEKTPNEYYEINQFLKKNYHNKKIFNSIELNTLFLFAANKFDYRLLKILTRYGIDVNYSNKKISSVLLHIICNANIITPDLTVKITKLLIKCGVNVNFKDKYGNSILTYAIRQNFNFLIPLLINARADVNSVDTMGCTALMHAVYNENHYAVKLLLDAGSNVNLIDNCIGQSALILAMISFNDSKTDPNCKEIINLLINAGSDLFICDRNNNTIFDLCEDYSSSKMINDMYAKSQENLLKLHQLKKQNFDKVFSNISVNCGHVKFNPDSFGAKIAKIMIKIRLNCNPKLSYDKLVNKNSDILKLLNINHFDDFVPFLSAYLNQ